MSTYSQYKIQLINTGGEAGQWGTITNNNFGSATPGTYRGFEQAIGGRADINMNTTPKTLTLTDSNDSQDARALYLNLTGTPGGAADLVVPALQKAYLVKNGSDQIVTIKVSGQTGVAIPVGKTVWVYNNGTDVVTAVDHIPSLTLGAALPVLSGGTGATTSTGSGAVVLATSPTLVTPALGTPASGTLTNATGLPISTGVSGLGTGVATALGANVTGSGGIALATSPTLVTPVLGTPTSGALTNCTADGTVAVGFRNIPQSGSAKTTSYTLATGDIGKLIEVGSGGSITVPNATFAAGDAVLIFNNTSGSITLTMSITTSYIGGVNADDDSISLATRGVANILFISGTVCVVTGNVT
jgi:hypothetical protein